MIVTVAPALPSPLRVAEPTRRPVRVALVQTRWHADPVEHLAVLDEGIRLAAAEGAEAVFLPELTLRRYPGDTPADPAQLADRSSAAAPEDLTSGPTASFAREAARRHGVFVHASVFEVVPAGEPAAVVGAGGLASVAETAADARGYNTAILVSPAGELVGRTRKTHIPISAGYYEDTYFRPGPADGAYPVHTPDGLDLRLGLPTCWDEWFPEVSRSYALAGADVLAYPTAIGSEPTFADFDTAGIWRHVIVANGITSGLFMVVPNRWGDEGDITFYGSSFISDPFGRVLVEAPRDADAVLVADLDLAQREEWLRLFPFLLTRRPDSYAALTAPVDAVAQGFGATEAAADAASGLGRGVTAEVGASAAGVAGAAAAGAVGASDGVLAERGGR